VIRITLQGGLGNQMFQYALGRRFEDMGREVTYDFTRVHYLDGDQPHNRYKPQYGLEGFETYVKAAGLVEALPVYGTDQVKFEHYDLEMDNVQLSGYWQSEKYFPDFDILDLEFTPRSMPTDQVCRWGDALREEDAVVMQVRRGDYLKFADFHGVMGEAYFYSGLHDLGGGKQYIVTDDEEWCKQHFPYATIINTGSRHWDIALMAEARRIVISNSSFGWWGAWLGERNYAEHLTVAPERWFATDKIDSNDIIPDRWTKI